MDSTTESNKEIIKRHLERKEKYLQKYKISKCLYCYFLHKKFLMKKNDKSNFFIHWLTEKCKCKTKEIIETNKTPSNLNKVSFKDDINVSNKNITLTTFNDVIIKVDENNDGNLENSEQEKNVSFNCDHSVKLTKANFTRYRKELKKLHSQVQQTSSMKSKRSSKSNSISGKSRNISKVSYASSLKEKHFDQQLRKSITKSMMTRNGCKTNFGCSSVCFNKSAISFNTNKRNIVSATLVPLNDSLIGDPLIFNYQNRDNHFIVKLIPDEVNVMNFIKKNVSMKLDVRHNLNKMKKYCEKFDEIESNFDELDTTEVTSEMIYSNRGDDLTCNDKMSKNSIDIEFRKSQVLHTTKEYSTRKKTEMVYEFNCEENSSCSQTDNQEYDPREFCTIESAKNCNYKVTVLSYKSKINLARLLPFNLDKYICEKYPNDSGNRDLSTFFDVTMSTNPVQTQVSEFDKSNCSSHLGTICYLCGNLYSTYSIHIHLSACKRHWERVSRILGKDIVIPEMPEPDELELEAVLSDKLSVDDNNVFTLHDAYNEIMRETSMLNQQRYNTSLSNNVDDVQINFICS